MNNNQPYEHYVQGGNQVPAFMKQSSVENPVDGNNNKIWENLPNNSIRTLTMKQAGNFLVYNEMGNLDLKIINKSTSAEIKPNSHINLNLIEKENDTGDKKIKNIKFKFMKEDYSNVASELLPIDLSK